MRSLVITEHGPPEVLRVQERPDPEPGPGEVLVRVRAAGINFADLLARAGLYPDAPKPPCVVGYEFAGELESAAGDLPAGAFAAGAHLHLAGYTLLRDGPPREAALEAQRRARTAGMTISLDPSSAAPLARFGAERFLALAGHPDLLLPNADEAAALTGETDARAAARALTVHAREVVVTLGGGGALWTDGRVVLEAAAHAASAADTTGAGDAFAAGFLATWLDGAPVGAALEAGNALTARAISSA
jgi:sugar/nucleoside kinase (ribokinase family)